MSNSFKTDDPDPGERGENKKKKSSWGESRGPAERGGWGRQSGGVMLHRRSELHQEKKKCANRQVQKMDGREGPNGRWLKILKRTEKRKRGKKKSVGGN